MNCDLNKLQHYFQFKQILQNKKLKQCYNNYFNILKEQERLKFPIFSIWQIQNKNIIYLSGDYIFIGIKDNKLLFIMLNSNYEQYYYDEKDIKNGNIKLRHSTLPFLDFYKKYLLSY